MTTPKLAPPMPEYYAQVEKERLGWLAHCAENNLDPDVGIFRMDEYGNVRHTVYEIAAGPAPGTPITLPQRYHVYTSYKYDNPQHEVDEAADGEMCYYDEVVAAIKAAGYEVAP